MSSYSRSSFIDLVIRMELAVRSSSRTTEMFGRYRPSTFHGALVASWPVVLMPRVTRLCQSRLWYQMRWMARGRGRERNGRDEANGTRCGRPFLSM